MKKLTIIIILLVALFLRTYRFRELSSFSFDEARDDLLEREMILQKKLTLLGPETRIGDKIIYFGPLHYYLMAPALAASHFDPVGPAFLTIALGVLTTVLIYFLTKSYLSTLFYAVFPLAVIYNRWAWNPNTIPFFCSMSLLFFFKKRYFLSGFFLGLAVQLHPVSWLLLFFFRQHWRPVILGIFLGISPIILFDLRHNFLYLRGYLGLFSADFSYRGFNWHYFLWTLPLLAYWLKSWPQKITLVIIFLSAAFTLGYLLTRPKVTTTNPQTIKEIATIIAADQKKTHLNFNIASFVDPDTRATAYRYFLALEAAVPLGVGEYSVADHLYVITFEDQARVLYNQTYEVFAFKPRRISRTWKIADENIYRLERN